MTSLRRLAVLPLLLGAFGVAACETGDPTMAVVDNPYPAPADGGVGPQMVVYETWWSVTLFPDPVPAGTESIANRVVKGSDYAYALLAPNWDPTSSTPPDALIPVRTKTMQSVARGDTLHIVISDGTVDGNCAAGSTLAQSDADFITQRIFPGAFAGYTYDAATCTKVATNTDAGLDDASTADASIDAEASDAASVDASKDVLDAGADANDGGL